MSRSLSRSWMLFTSLLTMAACSSSDRSTGLRPEFAISDAVHEGGTPGFYFLPPMVAQPTFNGAFDANITTLNPAIAICDVTNSPDANCGRTGGTPAILVFTATSAPAITVDPTTPQYQVNWNTQAAGFVAGHTYRVHVTAGAGGARRELGFADVLLTTTPGQAKFLQTGDIIVLQDGRTLPLHVRIETGIACDCWFTRASLTYARALTAVGVANGLLYAVGGGASAGGHSDNVAATESYNPATDSWTTRAPMPTPRNALGVGVVSGVLYAVGGISTSGSEVGTLEAYDPMTDSWTMKASMPTPRSALGVAALNGVLYAVGGCVGGASCPQQVGTVEAYDPATNTWTTRAPMPTPRGYLALGVMNGVLYAMGGYNGNHIATVEAYDPTTDSWTTKAPMPTPRNALGVGSVNGMLYAVGGQTTTVSAVGTNEAYDPATNTWTTKAPMPTPRNGLGVGVVNGVLYAVGGQPNVDAASVLGTVEAYQP